MRVRKGKKKEKWTSVKGVFNRPPRFLRDNADY